MKVHKPELVCPAGNWSSLKSAVLNGADSVYFGVKGLNMRHLATNFDTLEIKKVMAYLHEHKKKGYLALNVIITDCQLDRLHKILKEAKSCGVDAVILWDMAVFSLAKKMGLKIHLSTQASVSNREALKYYAKLGAKRIVLARECTLRDIKQITDYIKKAHLRCEIETFIHGAMCISVSGRCFLSQYAFGKSANKGECLQPCRREYLIKDKEEDKEYFLGKDYVLSPKDLCTIDFIDKLINAGIRSFKIEGRIRSSDYVKIVTSVYRKAIDAYFEGSLTNALKKSLKEKLATVYNRGFNDGFYFGEPKEWVSSRLEHTYEKIYLGEVARFFQRISVAEIKVLTGTLKKGDHILFTGKTTPAQMAIAQEIQDHHRPISKVLKGQTVGVKLPFRVKPKDKVFLRKKRPL